MIQRPPFKVFAGTNTRYLAEKICNSLGCELGKMNIQHFADGEFSVSFEESIRGCQVFLIQSTYPNADNLMELLLMIDAAKRASADSIIAVTPYFGWARQDRKDKPRVSIAFGEYIKSLKLKDMVIASPDVGGSKRANSYAKYFGVPLVLCHKSRAKANEVESMTVIGDVKDKNVILVDDMVDTAGTITKAADLMISKGALSVRAIASHAVMSDPATSRVTESKMTEMIFTDSIPYYKNCPKVHIISIADMFADTIRRVYENESISSQLII